MAQSCRISLPLSLAAQYGYRAVQVRDGVGVSLHPARLPWRCMATKGMGKLLGFTPCGWLQAEPAERIERMTQPGKPFLSSLKDGEAPGTMEICAVQHTWQ